ncbi:MAG: hypothetical protein Q9M92_01995 [Enterobacterales bacterium]|nr:hypothetical protein [Enterobacterales bacterium]
MLKKIIILSFIFFALSVNFKVSSNERTKLASYFSLDGKELSFTKWQHEPYAVRMGDIAQEYTLCSTSKYFCMWHITLPNKKLENKMSWVANKGIYEAGNWNDFSFLGRRTKVIKIIPKNIEIEVSVCPKAPINHR